MKAKAILSRGLLGLTVLVLALQLVPYGHGTSNPPVRSEPAWDSPRTRELARRACFDCHSNETRWPWYSQVAPVSWLVRHDVDEGREVLNVSDWSRPSEEAGEAAESVREGEMPPRPYLVLHGAARLSPQERQALIAGLERTFGKSHGHGDEDRDGDGD